MEETGNGIASKKSSLLNKLIKTILPLALGIVILYFLFRDIDFKEVWIILKEANWGILLISLPFGLLGNTIRGYRWELFLKPLGYNPKVSTLNYATYGGYAINFALPRAGELWKTGAVSKEENIPFTKAFGTMLLDRIFDTFTVLTITLFAFIFNMQFFIDQLKERKKALESIIEILQSPLFYIGIGAAIITTYIVLKYFSENIIVRKIKEFTKGIILDMKAIWKMDTKGRLLLYTIGIWGSYFLYFYITFFAFDFTKDLGFTAGLIAFALSSISMGVPSNGGLGPWQVAVVAALALYGVSGLEAKAFAVGVFGLQSLWVILCGFFGMGMLSLKKSK
ncbi:lysylphosphatidylglycerol synthase transmembrane domain-containing protein [Dysgonomonas sp. Marseille-P4361]|uniref:lysylphosphatidylglycerol synthase transmembrane domain-containing protein n=1 Tax=Dysgonomonas sp. Marseille-P4361 TaxID=2161820 RepID=UPI000D5563D9|nr:lysylphosphatidylglycerol synthase transmembrane domain-containing protein [Dysgonomonas sp. Marseille-P4361]